MRYTQQQFQWITRDNKLRLMGRPGEEDLRVVNHVIPREEQSIIFGDQRVIFIPKSDRLSFLRSAKALLVAEGYTLNTQCRKIISWSTDDDQWLLSRMVTQHGKSVWHITNLYYGGFIGESFSTRDKAVEWAQANHKALVEGT